MIKKYLCKYFGWDCKTFEISESDLVDVILKAWNRGAMCQEWNNNLASDEISDQQNQFLKEIINRDYSVLILKQRNLLIFEKLIEEIKRLNIKEVNTLIESKIGNL